MTALRDLLTDAFLEAGVLAVGETLSAAYAQFGLRKLNRLLDSWSAAGLVIDGSFSEYIYPEPSWGNGASIGPGRIIDTTLPLYVVDAEIYASDGIRTPLKVLNDLEWNQITDRGLVSGRPRAIYLDSKGPEGTFYIYPIADQNYTIQMVSKKTNGRL
jgi:hypothetical protein